MQPWRKGIAYKADTLEALAAKMGVPAADFAAEVKKYQGFCTAGKDTDFNKPVRELWFPTSIKLPIMPLSTIRPPILPFPVLMSIPISMC